MRREPFDLAQDRQKATVTSSRGEFQMFQSFQTFKPFKAFGEKKHETIITTQ